MPSRFMFNCAKITLMLMVARCSFAFAQTDAELLFRPWADDKQKLEAHGEVYVFPTAHFSSPTSDLDLTEIRSTARWRFATDEPLVPTLGFETFHLQLNDR